MLNCFLHLLAHYGETNYTNCQHAQDNIIMDWWFLVLFPMLLSWAYFTVLHSCVMVKMLISCWHFKTLAWYFLSFLLPILLFTPSLCSFRSLFDCLLRPGLFHLCLVNLFLSLLFCQAPFLAAFFLWGLPVFLTSTLNLCLPSPHSKPVFCFCHKWHSWDSDILPLVMN